ncbi:ARPC3 [Symbiodinium sp. KB8]|nr:ARPC3 [Symbiodinium sp. KB8]
MLPRQAPPHLSPAPSPSQPVYHSALNDVEPTLCGCSLLPVHGGGRGPAPAPTEGSGAQQCFTRNAGGTSTLHALDAAEEADIVDETIYFFRANVLFKSFEIQGGADRVLVYLTLYAQQCIAVASETSNFEEGAAALLELASKPFSLPGDAGFPLSSMMASPATPDERDTLRLYLKQLRTALSKRLAPKLYLEDGSPNKFWMAFSKRKFMNKELK